MNFMQTGEGASSASPVGLRCPVFESIRKTTILLEPWSAANRYEPVGSIAKLRGVLPSVETYSTALSMPFGPIANTARSEEHTSELQSHSDLVCRLLLEKKKNNI